MEFSDLMLIIGSGVLTMALRSYDHALFQKLGAIGILVTSFLVGYLPSGNILIGIALASIWFFLPWIELLTRVRKLKLPSEKAIQKQYPPSRDVFPNLRDITSELEDMGFELEEDSGWSNDVQKQFFRLMYNPEKRIQASICLLEQQSLAFSYMSFTSRMENGSQWTTWNYPFSYSLKLPPELHINRHSPEDTLEEVLLGHESFLIRNGIKNDAVMKIGDEEINSLFQEDIHRQIDHNLKVGVLYRSGDGDVQYTFRGLFFLWLQFLRDLVRI